MKCGIYKIFCSGNNKFYIGSTNNFKIRNGGHFSKLKRGKHPNRYLQNCYNKYGESSLSFSIIEECEEHKLIEREQYYIDLLRPDLNLSKEAGRVKIVVSTETRQKMSKSKKKQWETLTSLERDIIIKKMSENKRESIRINGFNKGVVKDKDAKSRKLSDSLRGRKHSAERKLQIGLSRKNKGKVLNPIKVLRAISLLNQGNTQKIVAKILGVKRNTISSIVTGVAWKDFTKYLK